MGVLTNDPKIGHANTMVSSKAAKIKPIQVAETPFLEA